MAVADLDGLLMADRAVDLVFYVDVVDKQRSVPVHCRKFEIKGASILMLVECDIVSGNIGANKESTLDEQAGRLGPTNTYFQ